MMLGNGILHQAKRVYDIYFLSVLTLFFLVHFVKEQFWEALGHCIVLPLSIIDIDASWITEQYNLFCTVSIDLVQ